MISNKPLDKDKRQHLDMLLSNISAEKKQLLEDNLGMTPSEHELYRVMDVYERVMGYNCNYHRIEYTKKFFQISQKSQEAYFFGFNSWD